MQFAYFCIKLHAKWINLPQTSNKAKMLQEVISTLAPEIVDGKFAVLKANNMGITVYIQL